jgi:hypothetical protein
MSAASRERMVADITAIQEAMPGMLAADSLAYILGYLVGLEAIDPMGWRRAMIALGEQHPTRQAMLDLVRQEPEPVLALVCRDCGAKRGAHAPWCGD